MLLAIFTSLFALTVARGSLLGLFVLDGVGASLCSLLHKAGLCSERTLEVANGRLAKDVDLDLLQSPCERVRDRSPVSG